MFYLKLAWRNIWRNHRRALITLFSIITAISLAIIAQSQQKGSQKLIIENTVGAFTGHIQIHQKDFWRKSGLDKNLKADPYLEKILSSIEQVLHVTPRLEAYALLSVGTKSQASLTVGIDPILEKHLSNPKNKLTSGDYFSSIDEKAILLSEGLAQSLSLKISDSLSIIGRDYQGIGFKKKYLIKGIFKLPNPTLNKSLSYLPLEEMQSLFKIGNRLSFYAVKVDDVEMLTSIKKEIDQNIPKKNYEIVKWSDKMPGFKQLIVSNRLGGQFMVGILYLIVSFGIFGTILIMMAERRYEFGLLIGIGMSRLRLILIILIELFMIALMGIFLGAMLVLPLILYLHQNPIRLRGEMSQALEEIGLEPLLVYSNDFSIFLNQGFIMGSIMLMISFYPIWYIKRVKVVEAIHS